VTHSFLKMKTTSSLKEKSTTHVPKFLTKTFDLLENKSFAHAIDWTNKGTSILIKDSVEFERILPKFFKHKKMASFVRQLNLYGFKKVKNSQNQFIYYNPKFQSGKRNMLKLLKRKNETPSVPTFDQDPEDSEELDLADENKELKKLHQEAAVRINALEIKLKEIAEQNLLLAEIAMKKENEIIQLKNKITFRCCDETDVSNKSTDSCLTPNQKVFEPRGIFKPFAKTPSQSKSLSSSDQDSYPRSNIVKNVIIKSNRDSDDSDSDRKSEDSVIRKRSGEDDRDISNTTGHNYLSLFSQTISNSKSLMPIFQFKMDASTEVSINAIMN